MNSINSSKEIYIIFLLKKQKILKNILIITAISDGKNLKNQWENLLSGEYLCKTSVFDCIIGGEICSYEQFFSGGYA